MVWLVPASGWPRGGMQKKQQKPTEVVLNQFAGQMVILSGAKTIDGAGSEYTASAPTSQPREEMSVSEIGDDIPF